jgi:hypothetical protein
MGGGAPSASERFAAFGCHTLSQCVHQVSHFGWCALLRLTYLLAMLLLFDQLLERVFVVILEFLWCEMPRFGFHNMGSQIEHVLGDSFIWNITEIICLLSNLVGITERDAQHTLAARSDRNHMFPRGENDVTKGHHTFLLDCFTNHCEGLPADLALGGDKVRGAPIELIDLVPWHELVDLYRVRAPDRNSLQFIVIYLDVVALADLVALDDVLLTNRLAGHGIKLAVFNPVSSLPVDLMKSDLLPLRDRREQPNRTRNKGQLEIAFPISARRHAVTPLYSLTPVHDRGDA